LEAVTSQLVSEVQADAQVKRAESAAIVKEARIRAAFIFGGAAVISLLAAGYLALAVTRSVTAPLRSLVDGSSALARGDFQHRVPTVGQDELAHLAAVFNDTAGKLQNLYQELQSRETYLAEAQELSHTGSFGWSLGGDRFFWSEETLRIFGYDPMSVAPTLDLLLRRIHPDDQPMVRESIRRVSQDGQELDLEFRIPCENSLVKHVRLVAHRVKRTSGEEFAGAIMDITASKLALEEIQVLSDARLSERTRIAQELHDTLLQGVLRASMQLGAADRRLQADSPAKPLVQQVLELMDNVMDEGRNAVLGLRPSKGLEDLEQAFSRTPEQLALGGVANFRVIVEGSSRSLRPLVRDEVYRIGREAVVNAFRHAGAKNIEVALVYKTNELRVSVRDDGNGIDPQVMQHGREGHWGLSGMRERAEKIGAKLRVWSSQTNGTEVEVRVPGRIAFESQRTDKSMAETFSD
jgi:signal transduction histidine kinase